MEQAKQATAWRREQRVSNSSWVQGSFVTPSTTAGELLAALGSAKVDKSECDSKKDSGISGKN